MDFTPYLQQNILRFYGGGNGNKRAIRLDDGIYMLKFPPAKNRGTLHYTNGCISEYVACHIIETLGLSVQQTKLGTVCQHGKEKIVVACKDFCTDGYRLFEFSMIKNNCLESSQQGQGTELHEILAAIEEQQQLPPQMVKEFFWDQFIADTLCGNFDRHNGNWGFLINEEKGTAKLAPIYDCGSCLYPQLTDEAMQDILANPKEIDLRVYQFPTSQIKVNGKKINPYNFLMTQENPDCTDALFRIVPRINMESIGAAIEQTPYISSIRKTFYQTMIEQRYEKILLPAYELATEHQAEGTLETETDSEDDFEL